ncbi:MAG: UdgX family uracil-DNA binding protein [Phycisphaeraceae bacterium]
MAGPSAAAYIPKQQTLTLPVLRDAAEGCEGCDLYRDATQTVFGEGPANAAVMIVGEQPGDNEDRQGRPFIGRAGELLDNVLERAGLHRREVYITNVVKHFRFERKNGRRSSLKPTMGQIRACLPWLEKEVELVRPKVLVCLGAVAAQAIISPDFRITQQRGEVFKTTWAPWTMATLHPAALLRIPDELQRHEAVERFVQDMTQVATQQHRVA